MGEERPTRGFEGGDELVNVILDGLTGTWIQATAFEAKAERHCYVGDGVFATVPTLEVLK
jgi:hypothetical protein